MRQMMNDIFVGVFPIIELACFNKNFDSVQATNFLDFFELKGVQLVGF